MKRRVFYVVNLDKGRLLALGLFILGALVLSFSTGYRFANTSEAASLHEPEKQDQMPLAFDSPDSANPESLSLNHVSDDDNGERNEPEKKQSDEKKGQTDRTSEDLSLKPAQAPSTRKEKSRPESKNSVSFSDIAKKNETRDAPPVKKSEPARKPAPAKKPEASKKEPAKKEAPRKEPAKPAKMYTLQMGAFSSRGAANRMAEQIRKEGLQPYVVTSGNLHLVRLGRSKTKSGLDAEEKKLRAARFRPITVSVGQ